MRTTLSILAAAALAGAASPTSAQPPASQHGTVSQKVNETVVTVRYDRPVARGRQLFGDGGIVLDGALWTPGANRATILELSAAAKVAGHDVAAGKYSLWTIPGGDSWTLILSRTWDTHHAIYPGEPDDLFRTTLRPERGAHMETLAFYFPVVGPYSTTLRMHWGDLILPIPIEVAR